jgi:hypothetical protein
VIATRVLRELTVAAPSSPERGRTLSAASGLVLAGKHMYVIADDENYLGVFAADGDADGQLVRLFAGDLPAEYAARKARKADPEALTRLPPFEGFPTGALMAWGSGSRPTRGTGALLALDADGALAGPPRPVDLSTLYAALEQRFPELNIEGAAVSGNELVLLQRGSRKQPENACIRLALPSVLGALARGEPIPAQPAMRACRVELGEIAGTALSFTDAAALPDGRIVFTAAAEDARDNYQDGAFAGAALGMLDREGRLLWQQALQSAQKVEGVHAWLQDGRIELLLVTDADDVAVPALLLSAQVA